MKGGEKMKPLFAVMYQNKEGGLVNEGIRYNVYHVCTIPIPVTNSKLVKPKGQVPMDLTFTIATFFMVVDSEARFKYIEAEKCTLISELL